MLSHGNVNSDENKIFPKKKKSRFIICGIPVHILFVLQKFYKTFRKYSVDMILRYVPTYHIHWAK